jgi:phage-related minor tail protein
MATSFNSDNTFFSPYAKGDVFSGSPSLSAYSSQVVSQPTMFAFARGAGVMGEAGPEAILPLKRGSDGKLGVQMQGGGGVQLSQTFVIDSNGQSNDSSTGAANDDAMRQFSGKMRDTAKQVILEEQRQGGSLWRMAHS